MRLFVSNRLTILVLLGVLAAVLIGCAEKERVVPVVDLEVGTRANRPSVAGSGAGGGGGGGGGGRSAFRGGPGLLAREDVQEELSISDDQIAEIEAAMPEDGGEREEIDAAMANILSVGQYDRYQQISLQREGLRALVRPAVAKSLGLSDDQVKTIEEAIEAARPTGGGFDRDAFMALREKMNEKILGALTDSQKANWEAMLGEEFELAQRQGGGGGGGMAIASED